MRSDIDRVLADDREERLQVMRIGTHRVRPRPTAGEPQELIDQPMTDDKHIALIAVPDDTTNLR